MTKKIAVMTMVTAGAIGMFAMKALARESAAKTEAQTGAAETVAVEKAGGWPCALAITCQAAAQAKTACTAQKCSSCPHGKDTDEDGLCKKRSTCQAHQARTCGRMPQRCQSACAANRPNVQTKTAAADDKDAVKTPPAQPAACAGRRCGRGACGR